MKKHLSIIMLSCITGTIFAEESVSNAELSRKLESVIGKVEKLEKRISALESANINVHKEVKQPAQSAKEAKSVSQNLLIPSGKKEKKSFFTDLRNQLRTDEVLSQGPWTKRKTWESVKRNMTSFQVRNLLGNPSNIKKSNNPRIEQVYIYSGDLNADGDVDIGKVNFYRDRLQSYESPFN